MKQNYIIGIDEVGRGPLAGPVVVAAVVIPKGMRFSIRDARSGKKIGTLKDSKKLSARQREAWNAYFKNHPSVQFALSRAQPRTIDRINISRAANLVALRAFNRLTAKCQLSKVNCAVYLDGGLYLGTKNGEKFIISPPPLPLLQGFAGRARFRRAGNFQFSRKSKLPVSNGKLRMVFERNLSVKTVIRGDEKINAVKIASIIAKCHRDRFMIRLAKKYPHYGFEFHKGYGTKMHVAAIKRHGISRIHRKSFCEKIGK